MSEIQFCSEVNPIPNIEPVLSEEPMNTTSRSERSLSNVAEAVDVIERVVGVPVVTAPDLTDDI